jgi:hypothetical protein
MELFIGLSIYCWQIPYEYLTPLQAAVGVVQKVKIARHDRIPVCSCYAHR